MIGVKSAVRSFAAAGSVQAKHSTGLWAIYISDRYTGSYRFTQEGTFLKAKWR